jgi:predicted PurR-regulated permease PerM
MAQPQERREIYSHRLKFLGMRRRHRRSYLTRVLLAVGAVGLVISIALFSWAVVDVLLLVFLGVLLAIALRTLAKPLARRTFISDKWALGAIVLLLALVFAGLGWFLMPEILNQADLLVAQVGKAIEQLEAIAREQFGEDGIGGIFGGSNPWLDPNNVFSQLMDTFTLTLEVLANALFVLFIGLFVAIDPHLYRSGIVSLIPPRGRKRTREVIDGVVRGLRAWLLGRIISMVVIGIVVSLGLWLLDIPLALVLGIIAALLEFIPVVGPVLAAVPGILIAFTLSPMQAAYVALFYLVVQQLEGNILTPVVQQWVVSLPPALGLSTVLALGILLGPLGVLAATPLTVVAFVMVRMIYLQDILEPNSEG